MHGISLLVVEVVLSESRLVLFHDEAYGSVQIQQVLIQPSTFPLPQRILDYDSIFQVINLTEHERLIHTCGQPGTVQSEVLDFHGHPFCTDYFGCA
jgi:hypothetical protein